jgi:carbon storage regulator
MESARRDRPRAGLHHGQTDRPNELARREGNKLVLTRRIGEEVVIADNIRLTVVSIKGKHIRLGITAPLSAHVARLELLARTPLRPQQLLESGDSGEAVS